MCTLCSHALQYQARPPSRAFLRPGHGQSAIVRQGVFGKDRGISKGPTRIFRHGFSLKSPVIFMQVREQISRIKQ